jgi:hypothetical protein
MNKYSIRFNKSRGQPGRGTMDHVWRVFENDSKEYLFKHLNIVTSVASEKDANGQDYNICCYGFLKIDKDTSTAIISAEEQKDARECGGCTECCKGWVTGEVYGRSFYEGKKCFYLQDACTIYPTRPVNPCQSFKCHWLATDDLPMWMRPDIAKAIVLHKREKDIEYYSVAECGSKIDSEVLSWMITWALNNKKNLCYFMNGSMNKIGSKEFAELDLR